MSRKIFFVFLIAILLASCSQQATEKLPEFPLSQGTTWVYSYEAYDPSPSDPTQIIKAIYQLTETVVETKIVSTYFVAHVKRQHKLIKAEHGWTGDLSSQPNEFWYVVNDNQIFQSNQPLDASSIKLDELTFDYEFPLSLKRSWCLLPHNSNEPQEILGCDFIGKREVVSKGSYEMPAGSFDDCYDLIDYFNGGNIFHKFCNGAGIVFMKFDHVGTRFGFEQALISYSVGAR